MEKKSKHSYSDCTRLCSDWWIPFPNICQNHNRKKVLQIPSITSHTFMVHKLNVLWILLPSIFNPEFQCVWRNKLLCYLIGKQNLKFLGLWSEYPQLPLMSQVSAADGSKGATGSVPCCNLTCIMQLGLRSTTVYNHGLVLFLCHGNAQGGHRAFLDKSLEAGSCQEPDTQSSC